MDPGGPQVLLQPLRCQALVAHQGPRLLPRSLRVGHASDIGGPARAFVPLRAVHRCRPAKPLVHRTCLDRHRLKRSATACTKNRPKTKNRATRCAIRRRCNNTCGCLNWQTTGAANQVSPVLCRYEQMLVPIADRIGETLYAEENALFLHKHYNTAYPVLSFIEDHLS